MNIFAVDKDPVLAAKSLPDKLVVKMPLETAQILSTALIEHDCESKTIYKATHSHHPCVVWAGYTKGNFDWLVKHGLALCDEYFARYGKVHGREHKSRQVIEACANLSKEVAFYRMYMTPFQQVMPENFRSDDPVAAYREYLHSKSYLANGLGWKHCNPPEWW